MRILKLIGEVNTSAISVGDNVRVCPDDCGRLLKGTVSSIEYHDCCTVNFMDRNWSDDLPSEDIIECECSRLNCSGWHVPGAKVLHFYINVYKISVNQFLYNFINFSLKKYRSKYF